jgi:hypothetical protein
MLRRRRGHTSAYYDKHVYVIGVFKECERYVWADDRWEIFGIFPLKYTSFSFLNSVVMEATQSLYLIGGTASHKPLDLIVRLDLLKLTFEVLDVKLPQPGRNIACFMLSSESTEIYFIVNQDLYLFKPSSNSCEYVKHVSHQLNCQGLCYYLDGTLYYTSDYVRALTFDIGDLA